MLNMRDKINRLEADFERFMEEPEVERIAERMAIKVMERAGFDMEHIQQTNVQVQWLLSLKRGVKGFFIAIGGVILSVIGTLAATYLTGKMSK